MVELRDVAGFRSTFDQAPDLVRAQLIRALEAPPEDPAAAAELDAVAVEITRRLRRAESPAAALEVAAAGRRRTEALRMEEALAAFALARDEICASIAEADPAVAAALTPLLQAARGEVGETLDAGAARSPALLTLHTAAQAVGWAVRGEPAKARRVLASIDRQRREQALVRELRAAGDIAGPEPAAGSLETLLASPLVLRHPSLRRTLAGEIAARSAPPDVHALRERLPEEPLVERLVLGAELREARAPGRAAEIVRRAGVMAFDIPQRSTAYVFEGFALLNHDLTQAARAFDRAIELGGDLTEALRGKLLIAHQVMQQASPGSAARKQAAREAATTAGRLARALQRDPESKPLAAAAEVLAARFWLSADDARAALAAAQQARAIGSGGLLAEIELIEVRALTRARPAEAEARLDALLANNPAHVELWRLRIELARQQGDSKRAAELLAAAAEATKDPALVAEARRLSAREKKLAPFEGLIPGATSAGTLVRELARVAFDEGDHGHGPLERAAPHREALDPAGRLAFDAAAIIFALLEDEESEAAARLREAVFTWQRASGDLARLLAASIYVHVQLGGALPAILALLEGNIPALVALTEVHIAAGMGREAMNVLRHFAAALPPDERTRLQRLANRAKKRVVELPGVPNPEQALREIDRALAPAFSLAAFIREQGDGDLDVEALDDIDPEDIDLSLPPEVEEQLDSMLDSMMRQTSRLPKARVRELEQRLAKLLSRDPSPRAIEEVAAILQELGATPAAVFELLRSLSPRVPQPPRRMR